MTDALTVLVVDVEESLPRYERWLSGRYDVETRDDCDAFERLEDLDVALLDRLPAESSDRTVSEFVRRARTCETPLSFVVESDSDEIHLHRCEPLGEPVTRSALLDTVERLRRRSRYDDRLAEFAALAAERGRLEAERPPIDLEGDPEYESLCRRLAELDDRLEGMADEFDAADYRAIFEAPDFAGRSRIRRGCWSS